MAAVFSHVSPGQHTKRGARHDCEHCYDQATNNRIQEAARRIRVAVSFQ